MCSSYKLMIRLSRQGTRAVLLPTKLLNGWSPDLSGGDVAIFVLEQERARLIINIRPLELPSRRHKVTLWKASGSPNELRQFLPFRAKPAPSNVPALRRAAVLVPPAFMCGERP